MLQNHSHCAETFSSGDNILTYRMREGSQFRFEAYPKWDQRCCPDKPAQNMEIEPTDYFAAHTEDEIEEVIVTCKKIKRVEQDSVRPIKTPASDDDFELRFGYENKRDEFELDLDWGKFFKDD